jgi:hypothetical protein
MQIQVEYMAGGNGLHDSTGEQIAFARPDGVSLVDLENGSLVSLVNIIPLRLVGIGQVLELAGAPTVSDFYVDHSYIRVTQPGSHVFDCDNDGTGSNIVPQTGMFAIRHSPMQTAPTEN